MTSLHHSRSFAFTPESETQIQEIMAQYPPGRAQSALLPLLDLAQRQCGGWLSREALEHVAERLSMPSIRVYEVASFYSMFHLQPVGRYLVQLCRTTPCWLRGSDDLMRACRDTLKIQVSQTTSDGLFTVVEVECLGACTQGPVVQINDTYYEDLTYESLCDLLGRLQRGEPLDNLPHVHRSSCSSCGCAAAPETSPSKKRRKRATHAS